MGHPCADCYPVAVVWEETQFVRDRIADRITTEAVVTQAVIASVLSGGKILENVLEELRDGR
jgi:hypothetical protein